MSNLWAYWIGLTNNDCHNWGQLQHQGFFSKFLMGGTQNFWSPGPRRGHSRMGGGGACEKIPTEAKTAHLVQN